jgi:hypothetical protein
MRGVGIEETVQTRPSHFCVNVKCCSDWDDEGGSGIFLVRDLKSIQV